MNSSDSRSGITEEQVGVLVEYVEDALANLESISSRLVTGDDRNPQNVADAIAWIHDGLRLMANAITPISAGPGRDANGGHVESLTEAMMGCSQSIENIASALRSLAESADRAVDLYARSLRDED